MNKLKEDIKSLITQGERLKSQILSPDWFKSRKSEIIAKHRNQQPLNSVTSGLLSYGVGELVSSLFGTGKRKAKSVTNKILKNNIKQQQEKEINILKNQFESHNRNLENQYIFWFNEIKRISSVQGFETISNRILDSQYKSKFDTRLNQAINVLKNLIDQIDRKENNPKNKSLLIKSGEPLKGKDSIIDFLHQSKIYVKIQEPYPSKELLRLIEETDSYGNIKIQLLIGKFNRNQKGIFEQELSSLRKTGKDIEVISIIGENSPPFHDRFIINEKSCISLGTSISGFGLRDSTINYLSEWSQIEEQFDKYLFENKTIHKGKECKRERL